MWIASSSLMTYPMVLPFFIVDQLVNRSFLLFVFFFQPLLLLVHLVEEPAQVVHLLLQIVDLVQLIDVVCLIDVNVTVRRCNAVMMFDVMLTIAILKIEM
jgi:hypothetical protein